MSKELARGAPGTGQLSSGFAEIYTPAALQPIASVNQQFLLLLATSGLSWNFPAISDLLASAPEIFPRLIEACPFTLFDLRFRDGKAWRKMAPPLTSELKSQPERADLVALTNSAVVLAWYAARRWPTNAELLLGATDEVVTELRSLELTQLQTISIQHSDWVRPRWADRISVWSELISLAGNPKAVRDGTLRVRAMEHFLGDLVT